MRSRDLIIFITVVLIVYSLANTYIFIKGFNALEGVVSLRAYFAVFLILSSTFVFGKILERNSSSVFVDILNVIGGFWLAIMLYATLLFFASDIIWLLGKISGLLKSNQREDFRYIALLVVAVSTTIILITGFFNSVLPVVRRYNISLNKSFNNGDSVRIAAVSDVHLGSVVRNRSLRKLSKMLSAEKPDILFLLGDLVDGEINPVLRDDLLKSLTLPEGCEVLAITGNHEYIGGIGKTLPYLKKHGLGVLMDEIAISKQGIQVIGRKDRDSFRYTGERRADLEELINKTDKSLPVIVLDHQPESKSSTGVNNYDLMLSGHTHNGQMWPFNYIVGLVFKDSYGHKQYNNSHHIISSGFGTWGPRVRIGSRSEIIIIDLHSKIDSDSL